MDEHLEWLFSLTDNLSGPAGKMSQSLGNLTNQLNSMEGALKTIEALHVGEAIAHSLEFAVEVGKKLAETVMDIGKEIFEAAGVAQKQALSFKLLLGDEGAEEALGYIDKIAKHSEFTRTELKTLTQQALFSGFGKEQLSNILPAVLDLATLKGGGIGAAEESLGALSRIKLTGHVDSRSLLRLGMEPQALAKQLGMTVKEMEAAVTGGTLGADKAINAVYDLIEKRQHGLLGTAAVEGGGTFMASIHKLTKLPESFFEKIADTKSFGKLTDFLDKLVKYLDPDSEFGRKVVKAITDTFDKLFDGLEPDAVMTKIEGWLQGITGFIDDLPNKIGSLEQAWKQIKPAVEATAETFLMIAKVVRELARELGEMTSALSKGYQGAKLFGGFLTEGIGSNRFDPKTIDEMQGKIDAAKGLGGALTRGLNSSQPDVSNAASNLADAATGAIQSTLEMHSPSRVFERMGVLTAQGFAMGLDHSAGMVSDAMSATMSPDDMGGIGTGGSRGGFGQTSVSVEINVNVEGGGDGEEIGRIVAKRMDVILPSALSAAFEKLAGEQGVDV